MSNAGPNTWFFQKADRRIGPLTWTELSALAAATQIRPEDEVSTDGEAWAPAASIEGLVFEAPPDGHLQYRSAQPGSALLTGRAIMLLANSAPYLRAMGAVFLLCVIFVILAAIYLGASGVENQSDGLIGVAIIYVVASLLYVPPTVFLFSFAASVRKFDRTRDPIPLEHACHAHLAFWKYTTILSVIAVLLYAFVFLGASLWGAFNSP